MTARSLRFVLFAGLILALAGGITVWQGMHRTPAPPGELKTVTEYRDEKPLPAFRLAGPKGELTEAGLRGRWHFLFFGYTQCPDICPGALSLMKDVSQRVAGAAGSSAVPPASTFGVVFVSVDLRRDTPDLLREYLAAFDPEFIGVSGSDEALKPLTSHLGVFYKRHDEKGGNYTVDHTATLYLIDPQGRLAATFSPPQRAEAVAKDFLRISAAR